MLAAYPWLAILPPIVAILLVLVTRKVTLSLGAGIVAAALLLANFHPVKTLEHIWQAALGLVWEDGGINWWTILVVAFLFILGILTAVIMMAGGTTAFSEWAAERIHSRKGAQVLAALLGMIIFIDDYFNSLAVGQVARPITDRYRVSRAKLAYLIDSTSAPVVVLMPFSSWGATIMSIMAPLTLAAGLAMTQIEVFLRAAFMNYYAIGALVLVWVVVLFGLEFGPMRKSEQKAEQEGELLPPGEDEELDLTDQVPSHEPGTIKTLLSPFIALLIGVGATMYVTGGLAAGSWGIIESLGDADVGLSLFVGGLLAWVVATYFYARSTKNNPDFSTSVYLSGVKLGARTMVTSVIILLFAWTLSNLIGALETGDYLASLLAQTTIAPVWLVPALFVVAGAMAFATGTSWGSFGILLPLAGDMMSAVPGGTELLVAAFGAVLAGSVWGDHSSPISDTTIMSSTGAGCPVPLHVNTQLPYALLGAVGAVVGYSVYAGTLSGPIGLLAAVIVIVVGAFALGWGANIAGSQATASAAASEAAR